MMKLNVLKKCSGKWILILLALMFFVPTQAQKSEEQLINRLNERDYPQWFNDAKLGIFIHWGLYSVPAYGGKESYAEWYLRGLQTGDSLRTAFMKENYGPNFTYKDFAGLFKAELFDANEWAKLFKKAGAKYVVLVSKHHDGYALWPSKFNRNWNSVDTGPKRDIVGEVTEAVHEEGLKMGLYYSLPEWNNPLHRWYTDPNDSIGEYVENYMIPQFKELVSTYKPEVIFTDGEWYNTAKQWHSAELINWYYDLIGPDAIVNNRWGHGIDTGFLTPEYSAGITETNRPWAEVRGVGRSFGLNRNEDLEAYGTSKELIQRFVQTVANGGGMILNVGPRADGQIPMIQQERLVQLGNWLDINGEAIYGSRPYQVHSEEKQVEFQRVDPKIDFNWVRNSPMKNIKEDDFKIHWEGFLVAPKTGTYTFEVQADDEARVKLDGKILLNQDYTAPDNEAEVMGAQTAAFTQAKVKLKKNETYPISIDYREKKQNASIRLFWKTDREEQGIIPESAFFQDKDKNESGLKGTYSSLKTHLAYTQNNKNIYAISFDWPEEELVLNIPNPGKNSRVTMLGLDRKLDWKYENGKLHIDTSKIGFNDLPSYDGWTFRIEKL
jgi:alpha-L-fucosidase